MGVDLHVTWEGLACSARHFRILPDTPVVTRVWLSQTADSFSHPHDAARTSVLALREDSPDRVASPHCRKAGNGYPKLVCLLSSVRQGHATHGVCLHRSYKHSHNPMMRIAPKMGPKMGVPGGSKKRAQTVPTGRVIKYPPKCAFFGTPETGPNPTPVGTPQIWPFPYIFVIEKGPKMAEKIFWKILGRTRKSIQFGKLDQKSLFFIMANRQRAFMEITIDGKVAGTLTFTLFSDYVPRTCENFMGWKSNLASNSYLIMSKS